MPLEIPVGIDIEPDDYGVYDGREIAYYLIRMAFEATVPYANGCAGCADRLFSAIAEAAMAEVHENGLRGSTYARGDEASKPERFQAHAEATEQLTLDLLGEGSGGTRH